MNFSLTPIARRPPPGLRSNKPMLREKLHRYPPSAIMPPKSQPNEAIHTFPMQLIAAGARAQIAKWIGKTFAMSSRSSSRGA